MSARVVVSVRVAAGSAAQQTALNDWLAEHPDVRSSLTEPRARVVIAEGAFSALSAPPDVVVRLLAAGCVCCVGQVPLRVTLTRLLREQRPSRLLLLLSGGEHLERVQRMLRAHPFAELLQPEPRSRHRIA